MRARLLLVAVLLLACVAWLLRDGRPNELESSGGRAPVPSVGGEAPSLSGVRREAPDVPAPAPRDPGPEGSRPGPEPERRTEPDVPTAVVRGVVRVRGTDRVVAGSSVTIQGTDAGEGATTDAKGGYLVHLPRGTTLRSAGVWPAREQAVHLMTSVPLGDRVLEGDLTLDLEVDPGITLVGHVVDADTGAPLDAAVVRYDSAAQTSTWVAVASGAFVLSGIDPTYLHGRTSCWIWAECPGYGRERVEIGIDLRSPTTSGIRIALRRGVTISGRVLFPDGHRPVGLWVRLEEHLPGASGWGRAVRVLGRVETSDDGTFVFPGIPPTGRAHLRVLGASEWGAGFGLGDVLSDLDLRTDRSDLVLRPQAAGFAKVGATYPNGDRVPEAMLEVVFRDARGATVRSTSTSDGVRFVSGVVDGVVAVDVYARKLLPQEAPGRERNRYFRGRGAVTVRAGWPARSGDADLVVALQEDHRSGALWPDDSKDVPWMNMDTTTASYGWLLTFVDADTGAPLAGRAIELRSGGGSASTHLRADARLHVGVGLGRSLIWAAVAGYEPMSFEVEPTEPGYEVRTVALKRLR